MDPTQHRIIGTPDLFGPLRGVALTTGNHVWNFSLEGARYDSNSNRAATRRVGDILSVVLIGTFVLALNFLQVARAHTYALGLLVVALVAALLFVLRQRRARNPLYDLKVAARPTFWLAAVDGDKYPVTPGGRMVGTVDIIVGVALFSTIAAFLANAFTNHRKQAEEKEATDAASPQTLLAEVRRLANELEQRDTGLQARLAADQDRYAAALDARLARIEALLGARRPED